MSTLELIIRPFQSRDITPPQRIVGKAKVFTPIVLQFGKGGFDPIFKVNMSFAMTTEDIGEDKKDKLKEVRREGAVLRISNPDDPDSWVEVARLETQTLKRDPPADPPKPGDKPLKPRVIHQFKVLQQGDYKREYPSNVEFKGRFDWLTSEGGQSG